MSFIIDSWFPPNLKVNGSRLQKREPFDKDTYKSQDQRYEPSRYTIFVRDKDNHLWSAKPDSFTTKGSGSILQNEQELKECFNYYASYKETLLILDEVRYTLSDELKALFPADLENNFFQLKYRLKNSPAAEIEKRLSYQGNDIVLSKAILENEDGEPFDYQEAENFELWYIDLSRGKVEPLSIPDEEGIKETTFSLAAPGEDVLVDQLQDFVLSFFEKNKDKAAAVEETKSLLVEAERELLTSYNGTPDEADLIGFLSNRFEELTPFLQALEKE